jgi:RNA polymerase sigma-70 factor (ECF subfamily)
MGICADEGPSDAELITRSMTEPRCFAPLFERHAVAVHRYLAAKTNSTDVEDLVSETFLTAFSSRVHFDTSHPCALPWLFGIANNVHRHHWRSEGRRQSRLRRVVPPKDTADPTDQLVEHLDSRAHESEFADAFASLSEHQRETFILIGDLGLSYEDAGLALGVPIGTIRSRMNRARSRLRELLGIDGQYTGTTSRTASERHPE